MYVHIRTNQSLLCLSPFRPLWLYGIVVPWIFLLASATLVTAVLVYDWRLQRYAYSRTQQIQDDDKDDCVGETVRERLPPPPVLRQHSLGKVFSILQMPRIRVPSRPQPRLQQPRGESVRRMVENMERFSV